MGVVKGLAKIKEREARKEAEKAERKARKEERAEGRPDWFKIKGGQSVKVAFLQELDEDSPNYSSKNGLGFIALEHSNPQNWQRKAVCTLNEDDEYEPGVCWACDQHREDYKAGWYQKERLYINVLVDDGENEPHVAVLSQSTGGRMITPTLLEYAVDDGTITDKWFIIKRTGDDSDDTNYTIRSGKEHGLSVDDYDVFDLDKALYNIPYAEQEAHYLNTRNSDKADSEKASTTPVPVSAATTDNEW